MESMSSRTNYGPVTDMLESILFLMIEMKLFMSVSHFLSVDDFIDTSKT